MPTARNQLLVLEGVRDVFVAAPAINGGVSPPWLSVTRADDAAWETLEPKVQALLDALPSGETSAPEESVPENTAAELPVDGVAADIEECLEARVRPSVQADGGDVELVRWDPASGEVVLLLKGACRGCPQSAVTLKETILKTLRYFIPEVRTVVAEEEELAEDADDPFADIPWEHDGEPAGKTLIELHAAGTPFFSTFAGMKVEGRMLKRVKFMSLLELSGRTPEHILVNCPSCKARRTIEDPQDILRADKGNAVGKAAVMICPACAVVISK